MTILLTGITSATGVAIGCALRTAGYAVTALHARAAADYAPWEHQRLQTAHAHGITCVHQALPASAETLTALCAAHGIRIAIHHAGYTRNNAVRDYDAERGDDIHSAPLAALYAALAATGGRGVIVTGTAAEYGAGVAPWRESDPCHPVLPYGVSKLYATQCAAQLALQYQLPTRVARLFMPIGPHMNPGTLLGLATNALATGTPLQLSSCRAVRDFVGIADIATAYRQIVASLEHTTTVWNILNICSGQGISVRDFLCRWSTHLAIEPPWHFDQQPDRPGDPPIVVGNPAHTANIIGWRAKTLDQLLPTMIASAAA